jgi:PAS domain S-box-containing protein
MRGATENPNDAHLGADPDPGGPERGHGHGNGPGHASSRGNSTAQHDGESAPEQCRDRAIAAARVGIWHWDIAAGCARFDADWCRGVGIDPTAEAWAPGGWHHNVHPDDLPDLRERLTSLRSAGSGLFEAEYRLLTVDYRWMWILQRGRVMRRDAQGRALEVAGICLDVDERQREVVLLRENEARLSTALWGARAAFWTWHLPTNRGTRSALWFAMTGYSREEWESVPLPFTSRLHPEDRERVAAAAAAYCEGKTESIECEYRIRTAQGSWKWMLGRGRSVEWDLEGKATLIIGVSLDIDAQKQAEARLRHGEARLEERCLLAAEAAHGVIYEVDLLTRRVEWIGAERLLGCAPGEVPASSAAWRELIHPDDRWILAEPPTAPQDSERRGTGTCYRVRHRAGHYLHVRDHAAIVRDGEGRAIRVVGITIDVSEREAAGRQLAELVMFVRNMVAGLRAEGSRTLTDAELVLGGLERMLDAGDDAPPASVMAGDL